MTHNRRVGTICGRQDAAEVVMDWEVDFSSPSMKWDRNFYYSDFFDFSDRTFVLKLGPELYESTYYISLHLNLVESCPPTKVDYTLTACKTTKERTSGTYTFKMANDGPSLKWIEIIRYRLGDGPIGIVTFSATLKMIVTNCSWPITESEIVGRIREIKSTPVYNELLWEIDDAHRLLFTRQESSSPIFLFNAIKSQLTLGFIDKEIVMRLGMYDCAEHFFWNAGIRRVDGTECYIGSGQLTAHVWFSSGSWTGPARKTLLMETLGLLPKGVLTLFVRISALMAWGGTAQASVQKQDIATVEGNGHRTPEKTVTADACVGAESDIKEQGSEGFKGWKPTKDDLRTIQQYRQMLRSDEDRECILRARREEAQAKLREQFNQLRLSREDDDDIYKLCAA